jgi:hypothetical protein
MSRARRRPDVPLYRGMTDRYAIRHFEQLHSEALGHRVAFGRFELIGGTLLVS